MIKIITFITFFWLVGLIASEELVVVQKISSSGKNMMIRRGKIDGVLKGQISLFSTAKISILARAIEVSKDFSLWEASDPNVIFPFIREDIVTLNNSPENVWTQIARIEGRFQQERESRVKSAIFPGDVVMRGNLAVGINEAISQTVSSQYDGRSGYSFELEKYFKLLDRLELSFGVRYDQENARITNPVLIIPSVRYFLTSRLTYHFYPAPPLKGNVYIAIGGGYGRSETTVDGEIMTGTGDILPSLHLGYITPIKKSWNFLVEGTLESLSISESFSGQDPLNTNLTLAKLAVGVKF